jgi:ankyrin repeat protein
MGCVYSAKEITRDVIVAVKKILFQYDNIQDLEYAEYSIRKEYQLLSKLTHHGIPEVSDFFKAKDPDTGRTAHYLVMEYIDGKDLESTMIERDNHPLPVKEVLNYFIQILQILHYLHSQDPPIVYRDLKPSNIMIRWRDENVFLIDFGIARFFEPQKKGTRIGTPGYAPPEQYKGFTEPRTDIYSLGAVIYYLLSGLDPETGAMPAFTFTPLKEIKRSIPDYLDNIIMEMLSFEIPDRPSSAMKIIKYLESMNNKKENKKSSSIHLPECNLWSKMPKSNTDGDNETKDEEGMTSLHKAVINNDLGLLETLITKGFNVNSPAEYRWTPLHFAADRNHIKIAEFLMIYGADINAQNSDGKTPLHLAAFRNSEEILFSLLQNKADPNIHARDGSTALHYAAGRGFIFIAGMLLEFGAFVNARDNCGRTPLISAAFEGNQLMVKLLLQKGAEVNSQPLDGWSALHHAAIRGHEDVVYLLIENGADINAVDKEENTPLDVAQHYERHNIVKILKKYEAKGKPSWMRTLGIKI